MPKISRRTFMWISGGTGAALAAEPGRKFINKLIPYVHPPQHAHPGEWSFFATTCRECPAGCGMHLRHRDGRVTKAEGNPDHPVNRGGLCPGGQSSVQGLYDPDRVTGVLHRVSVENTEKRTWEAAIDMIGKRLAAGGRPAVISGLQTGTLSEVLEEFAGKFGGGRLLWYEPFNYESLKSAHNALFGLPLIPSYHLGKCDLIISFASDFLESWGSPVSYARQFSDMHALRGGRPGRLIYIGPRLSMTAANADEFVQVEPGQIGLVAMAMLGVMLERGWAKKNIPGFSSSIRNSIAAAGAIPGISREWLEKISRSFVTAGGSVALAGPLGGSGILATQTAAACAVLNYAAGRIGSIVDFSRTQSVSKLASEAETERFLDSLGPKDVLFIHDCNPLYARSRSSGKLSKAGMLVCLGTLRDETAQAAEWFLPIDSPLESWGDYEPAAGIHCIMQPTMERLHDTRLAGDVFLKLAEAAGRPLVRYKAPDFRGWLMERWEGLRRQVAPGTPKDNFWRKALQNGGVWREQQGTSGVALRDNAAKLFSAPLPSRQGTETEDVELWPWASVMQHDGRLANRGWLQEAPDPVTFISWGNWIDLHPRTAEVMKLRDGDVAELRSAAGAVHCPVRLTDEVTERTAAIAFGYGHTGMGRIAAGVGANIFQLLGGAGDDAVFTRARLRRVGGKKDHDPTYTSPTREQFDRHIVKWQSLSLLRLMKPGEGEELDMPLPEGYRRERDMYPPREYLQHRWGMVIDLHRCIGCGACAVACYAENNIAVMEKKQVGRQREMAWLRVVPYRKPGEQRRYGWLPLLCQHCDAAPCEPVCPVFAAVHNEEGLNSQIYNRCIGTRYCSNNCPYKVRRFNWLNAEWRKPLDLQLNPEVTVRSRGVMEKCTFCIQRIRQVQHRAALENRRVRDGEIQPACAQSCPTKAFTFGDLLDKNAQVTKLMRNDPRRYQVLSELNTKPAVVYLSRVENDVDT